MSTPATEGGLNESFDNAGNTEQVAFRAARNLIRYCLQEMIPLNALAAGELLAKAPGLPGGASASAGAFHVLQPVVLQCPEAHCDAAKCCCRHSCDCGIACDCTWPAGTGRGIRKRRCIPRTAARRLAAISAISAHCNVLMLRNVVAGIAAT